VRFISRKHSGREGSNDKVVTIPFKRGSSLGLHSEKICPRRRCLPILWTDAAVTKQDDLYGNLKHWITGTQGTTKRDVGAERGTAFLCDISTHVCTYSRDIYTTKRTQSGRSRRAYISWHSFHPAMPLFAVTRL
jgi:hypothetical protein